MKIIDLRSDTVTLPTQEMLRAIYDSDLGDDVYGEDPATNRLEEMAAERTGKEAALMVVSGTMGNLVSILTHCRRGEEVILGNKSHTFIYEAGGMSALGGIHPHTVVNQPDGTMLLEDIQLAIRSDNIHFPRTRLICLENTHNYCGGTVLPVQYMEETAALAQKNSLQVHLDGARIFNAAVALGVDVKELTRYVDSVSFCLSKGLSAPVGSVICGSSNFIEEARRNRKMLGGGMRQCGIIAAAGIIALEQMVERLNEDHANARRLAEGIAGIPYLSIDLDKVQTNIVYFNLKSEKITTGTLVRQLANDGIKISSSGTTRLRAVTHYGISTKDIDITLKALQKYMKEIYKQ
ncbi:MAG: low-specificity L-threonine aldolase [Sedimentisphaerales bacterium]|nr:low-specificity L-threonine aldolase [Sedimentisphaerales bacterium]